MNKKWIQWGLLGLFSLALGASGLAKTAHAEMMVQNMAHLNYPEYLLTILGPAYLIGVVALLQPKVPVLREWAYAGFTIAMLGAIASHILAGDPFTGYIVPIVLLALLLGSYALEKELI